MIDICKVYVGLNKVFLYHKRNYYAGGTFVRSNLSSNLSIYLILKITNYIDRILIVISVEY